MYRVRTSPRPSNHYIDADCVLDEPPQWFAEVTSAITDSMVNLYDDTSSQLDETTLCVMHALTMVAKVGLLRPRIAVQVC